MSLILLHPILKTIRLVGFQFQNELIQLKMSFQNRTGGQKLNSKV